MAGLGALQHRGVKVAAILLEPGTFGAAESALGVFATLASNDVYTYIVKRDDDLQSALGAEADDQFAPGGVTADGREGWI